MQPDQQALVDRSSLDSLLAFNVKHQFFAGMEMYGCKLGNVSYLVSFDNNAPHYKWRASWQREGQRTTRLRKGYDTRDAAILALKKVARCHAA